MGPRGALIWPERLLQFLSLTFSLKMGMTKVLYASRMVGMLTTVSGITAHMRGKFVGGGGFRLLRRRVSASSPGDILFHKESLLSSPGHWQIFFLPVVNIFQTPRAQGKRFIKTITYSENHFSFLIAM